jgi:hypothetical protein
VSSASGDAVLSVGVFVVSCAEQVAVMGEPSDEPVFPDRTGPSASERVLAERVESSAGDLPLQLGRVRAHSANAGKRDSHSARARTGRSKSAHMVRSRAGWMIATRSSTRPS